MQPSFDAWLAILPAQFAVAGFSMCLLAVLYIARKAWLRYSERRLHRELMQRAMNGRTPPRPAAKLTTITIGGIERCADCGRFLSMEPGRITDAIVEWPHFPQPHVGCRACAARDDAADAVGPNFVKVARCTRCGMEMKLDLNRFNANEISERVCDWNDAHRGCNRFHRNREW